MILGLSDLLDVIYPFLMKKTILAGSVLTFAPLKIVSFYAPDKLLGKKQRIMINCLNLPFTCLEFHTQHGSVHKNLSFISKGVGVISFTL